MLFLFWVVIIVVPSLYPLSHIFQWLLNRQNLHQAFGKVVNTLFGMPMRVLGLSLDSASNSSFLLRYTLKNSKWWLKYGGPCCPCETDRLTSGPLLSGSQSHGYRGFLISKWAGWGSICPSLSCSVFWISKKKYTHLKKDNIKSHIKKEHGLKWN